MDFISLLQKLGLSYLICGIYFSSKTCTIICNFKKFYPFFKKHGILYVIFGISFSSQKTWTIICNLKFFYYFFKNMDYSMQFLEFLSLLHKHGLSYASFKKSFLISKDVDYHM